MKMARIKASKEVASRMFAKPCNFAHSFVFRGSYPVFKGSQKFAAFFVSEVAHLLTNLKSSSSTLRRGKSVM